MIKVQTPTQGTRAFDLGNGLGKSWIRIHETVPNSLMRSVVVMEITIVADGMPQATITDKPKAMQALRF